MILPNGFLFGLLFVAPVAALPFVLLRLSLKVLRRHHWSSFALAGAFAGYGLSAYFAETKSWSALWGDTRLPWFALIGAVAGAVAAITEGLLGQVRVDAGC